MVYSIHLCRHRIKSRNTEAVFRKVGFKIHNCKIKILRIDTKYANVSSIRHFYWGCGAVLLPWRHYQGCGELPTSKSATNKSVFLYTEATTHPDVKNGFDTPSQNLIITSPKYLFNGTSMANAIVPSWSTKNRMVSRRQQGNLVSKSTDWRKTKWYRCAN